MKTILILLCLLVAGEAGAESVVFEDSEGRDIFTTNVKTHAFASKNKRGNWIRLSKEYYSRPVVTSNERDYIIEFYDFTEEVKKLNQSGKKDGEK